MKDITLKCPECGLDNVIEGDNDELWYCQQSYCKAVIELEELDIVGGDR